jgi:hypothetical protein
VACEVLKHRGALVNKSAAMQQMFEDGGNVADVADFVRVR